MSKPFTHQVERQVHFKYTNLTDEANGWVGLQKPVDLCACVIEERGNGEGSGSQAISLMSDTLRYINLANVARDCAEAG